MALKHLGTALVISGVVCLTALPQARAADTLEAENTNNGAPTDDNVNASVESSRGDHSFHNRTYGSYFHGEIPPKANAMDYYYGPNATPGRHSCTHDEGVKGSNHGGDHGSNGQGKGYATGYFYGCPDYTGEGPLAEGTWTNEPLMPAVWKDPKWSSDSRTNGAYSDEYAHGMTSYVSDGMHSAPAKPQAAPPAAPAAAAAPPIAAAPVAPVDTSPVPLTAQPVQ